MNKLEADKDKNRLVVSLGSNINRERNIPAAVALLAKMCTIVEVSSLYETEPVGLKEQPAFWNAAVLLETELGPISFQQKVIATIENQLDRVRTNNRNAPRTIDIDLILFNQEVFELDGDHPIPDPDLVLFPHILVPVAEILVHERHPETGQSFIEIAATVQSRQENLGLKKVGPVNWEKNIDLDN
jgi:2-amino-4-hydroxy-6-hydroxymethyldihydropteridine diphosphokinase